MLIGDHSASAATLNGRIVSIAYGDTVTLLDANLAQVEAGMAWHYKEYAREQRAPDRRRYAQAEYASASETDRDFAAKPQSVPFRRLDYLIKPPPAPAPDPQ